MYVYINIHIYVYIYTYLYIFVYVHTNAKDDTQRSAILPSIDLVLEPPFLYKTTHAYQLVHIYEYRNISIYVDGFCLRATWISALQ